MSVSTGIVCIRSLLPDLWEACKAVLLYRGFRSEGIGIRVVSDDNNDYTARGVVVAYVPERKEDREVD